MMLGWRTVSHRLAKRLAERISVLLSCLIAVNAAGVELSEIDMLIGQVEADRQLVVAAASGGVEAVSDGHTLEEQFRQSQDSLNLARASTLAEYCALDSIAILDLHATGNSWRQIADDLSVHPSLIGIEIVDPRPPILAPISNTR